MGDKKTIGTGGDVKDWLLGFIDKSSGLPLSFRKQALNKAMNLLNDEQIGFLLGKEKGATGTVQGARFLAHFLGGGGEPWKAEISDEEWEDIIEGAPTQYSMTKEEVEQWKQGEDAYGTRFKGVWKPSTNPKFPHSEGWEHKQINMSLTGSRKAHEGSWTRERKKELHDILGSETSIRRRKLDGGGYEYQIAEDFDLTAGRKEYWEERLEQEDLDLGLPIGTTLSKGAWSGKLASTRTMSKSSAEMIKAMFPEFIETTVTPSDSSHYPAAMKKSIEENISSIYTREALAEAGTPFPIMSSYFSKPGEKEMPPRIENLLMNLFKGW
jgi:hypothetical protein|tara:strand:+ start:2851 stop:3825 length:975 start_codon:yes stop_codon:yes gene_type:complete